MKIMTNDSLKAAGGINRRLREIKNYISKRKENIQIISLKIDKKNYLTKERKFSSYGIKLPKKINPNFPYLRLKSEKEIRNRFKLLSKPIEKIVKKEKPDVFFIVGTFFFPWALLQCAIKFKIPIVHLYAGSAVTEFHPPNGKLSKNYKRLELEFIENSNYTIFNSRIGLKNIKSIFRKLPKNYSVIWNGVNEEMFRDKPSKDRNGIGYISRYDLFKNPKFLFKINKIFKKREYKTKFYIISNINKNISLYHKLLNEGFIIDPQTKDDKKLRKFYQARSTLISPSKFETFGNIAVESIAAGVPCFISNGIGASEVYKYIKLDKFLFNPDDLNKACKKLIGLDRDKLIIGDGTRKKLYQKCNWDKVIKSYLKILRKVA